MVQIGISGVGVTSQGTTNIAPSQDPAGIFDVNGNFNATAYVNEAAAYGTAAMIPERYGNSWSAYHATDPSASAPTWWLAPTTYWQNPDSKPETLYYSLGTPNPSDSGDFSSDYAEVAHLYNSSVSGSAPGIDGIGTLIFTNYVWAGQPQLYWSVEGAGQPNVTLCCGRAPAGTQQPVQVTRALGASEAAACSYMVFETGLVACGEAGNTGWVGAYGPEGTGNVMGGYQFNPFPANFHPTAASVTSNGEFLLVTGWNTSTDQGQLAVIALGSIVDSWAFPQYEWTENYPGFRNYSLAGFSKLLGVINLPDMVAPTAVEAVGNWVYDANSQWLPGHVTPGNFPLSTEANWACFEIGNPTSCASNTWYDTAGFALVASRWERKVILINLTPLFQEIAAGMFTSFTTFRANVANTGTGAGQWPPTFAENPSETPVIEYTMNFSAPVTAISASLYADDLAFIATDDNTLRVWSTNGIQERTGTGASASELYTIPVGNNITRIAHMKHWYAADNGINGAERYQYICMSRGDKTITWVSMASGSPSIVTTLSDSRLVDPVSVEDNQNHGTQSSLIDIADYGGANVKGYRYGPVIEATTPGTPTYGMGRTGTDPFEYEGLYTPATAPFDISINNVP